jgi:sec-independent protein translocase protein TatB
MFSVPHLVIIFIVVLVVFGPHKLPELARSLGKMMAEFRKASTDFKMAFEEEMRNIERQAREAEWKKSHEGTAAAGTEQQLATLATPAGTESPRILPETVATPEPTISPVSEAVAREPQSSAQPSSESGAELVSADEPPVTEGTAPSEPGPAQNPHAESRSANPGELPAHDQRQPA